ncbi:hypothetical protein AAC387_Pa03g3267 [Persea americana]
MGLRICLLSLLLCSLCLSSLGEKVTVTVRVVTTSAETDDPFVCATLDWWPPTKCDCKMCPWGNGSILNLDLDNPILLNAVKAFNPLRIRLGGSLQNQVLYNIRNSTEKCDNFRLCSKGLFGFSNGCLTTERWDKINEFLLKAGAVGTFGLNALYGKQEPTNSMDTLWTGAWRPTNADQLIQYTISKGYKIDSWEFGNELSGNAVGARVEANQYARDMIVLKGLLTELYKNTSIQAKILGPGGFFDQKWFAEFLATTGPNVVDAVTHHVYNLGAGLNPELLYKMQDPHLLRNTAQIYKDIEHAIRSFGPWSSTWVSESGSAYNNGGRDVSQGFVNSFWYLDQLGMSSTHNHKVYCRQTLIGGNYGLLNTTTMMPTPDYYSALLFHRLMGKDVLTSTHNGPPSLRAYSHCSPGNKTGSNGITLLLINLSNSTSVDISIAADLNLYAPMTMSMKTKSSVPREEYHLTLKDGNLKSTTMLLNGCPLQLTAAGDIPPLEPKLVDDSLPLIVGPSSIVFVTLKGFKAPACEIHSPIGPLPDGIIIP